MAPTISYISGAAAASTTVTMSSHQAGDLIICYAFRTGSTTAPTVPAGWTSLGAQTLASPATSAVTAYKIAASGSETTGTWTNASGVAVNVFRSTGNWITGRLYPVYGTGSSNSLTYPDYPYLAKETVWYLRCAGHTTATNMTTNTPSGWTARAGVSTRVRTISTSAASTVAANSVGTNTQSVSASSGWITATVAIVSETPVPPPVDVYVSSGNTQVYKIAADTGAVTSLGFTSLAGAGGVDVGSDGAVYVADYSAGQVQKMLSGVQSSVGFTGITTFYMTATSVGPDGAVYVTGNGQVHKMLSGVQTDVGFTGLSGGLSALTVGPDGAVYTGNAAQVYKMLGGVQSSLGFTGLGTICGLAIGPDGAVYVLHRSGAYVGTVSKMLGGVQTDSAITGSLITSASSMGIDSTAAYTSDAHQVYRVVGGTPTNIGWTLGAPTGVATFPLGGSANTTNFFQFF